MAVGFMLNIGIVFCAFSAVFAASVLFYCFVFVKKPDTEPVPLRRKVFMLAVMVCGYPISRLLRYLVICFFGDPAIGGAVFTFSLGVLTFIVSAVFSVLLWMNRRKS